MAKLSIFGNSYLWTCNSVECYTAIENTVYSAEATLLYIIRKRDIKSQSWRKKFQFELIEFIHSQNERSLYECIWCDRWQKLLQILLDGDILISETFHSNIYDVSIFFNTISKINVQCYYPLSTIPHPFIFAKFFRMPMAYFTDLNSLLVDVTLIPELFIDFIIIINWSCANHSLSFLHFHTPNSNPFVILLYSIYLI